MNGAMILARTVLTSPVLMTGLFRWRKLIKTLIIVKINPHKYTESFALQGHGAEPDQT